MMNNKLESHIKICTLLKDLVKKTISTDNFIDNFEQIYFGLTEESSNEIIENIYEDINYYEPNPLLQEESKNFLSEDDLRRRLESYLKQIHGSPGN